MDIETPADAVKYLRGDWSGVGGGPIVTVERLLDQSGYFEVPHLLLTYIDYLSGLVSGKGPDAQLSDVRDFFRRYFPSKYETPSAWLIYMYRHGLVHHYTPKRIEVDPDHLVGWWVSLDGDEKGEHLKVTVSEKKAGLYHLRLFAREFVADFKLAVDLLVDQLLRDSSLFALFKKGYDAFGVAEKLDKVRRPSYVSDSDKEWLRAQTGAPEKPPSRGGRATKKRGKKTGKKARVTRSSKASKGTSATRSRGRGS